MVVPARWERAYTGPTAMRARHLAIPQCAELKGVVCYGIPPYFFAIVVPGSFSTSLVLTVISVR